MPVMVSEVSSSAHPRGPKVRHAPSLAVFCAASWKAAVLTAWWRWLALEPIIPAQLAWVSVAAKRVSPNASRVSHHLVGSMCEYLDGPGQRLARPDALIPLGPCQLQEEDEELGER